MFNTPILFVVFNRPDITKRTFAVIRKVKPKRLYIACDGPRREFSSDIGNISLVKEIVEDIDWECEIKKRYNHINFGCRVSVKGAIDWFFENEEDGIILEDDCLPSLSFFSYCEVLLKHYKNDRSVMHISGFNEYNVIESSSDYGFTYKNFVWGWATWRRAWSLYDKNLSYLDEFIQENYFWNISKSKKLNKAWASGLKKNLDDNFSSWVAPWQYSIWINGGLGIFPSKNLISNIGFNNLATGKKSSHSRWSSTKIHEISFPLRHPKIKMRSPLYDLNVMPIFKRFRNQFINFVKNLSNEIRTTKCF